MILDPQFTVGNFLSVLGAVGVAIGLVWRTSGQTTRLHNRLEQGDRRMDGLDREGEKLRMEIRDVRHEFVRDIDSLRSELRDAMKQTQARLDQIFNILSQQWPQKP